MTDTATTSSGELIDLARNLRSGALSVEEYLGRLQLHFDPREGQLRAFLPETGRFDRLRDEAKALQFRYPRPEERPPLYGVPVGIKDIFHVDGYPTKAGSRLPEDELGGQEAASVSLLKEVGALILGKTVTTEFAYFAPGPTRNPHHLEHTPGGSSSGSAAAVGAGLAPLALGTQTIGSITRLSFMRTLEERAAAALPWATLYGISLEPQEAPAKKIPSVGESTGLNFGWYSLKKPFSSKLADRMELRLAVPPEGTAPTARTTRSVSVSTGCPLSLSSE